MLESYLVFGGLFVCVVLSGYKAQKRDSVKSLILAILLLTLVAGLRAENVGLDTAGYINIFNSLSQGHMTPWIEAGFVYVSYLLLKLWNNYTFLFFLYSFLINSLILLRFWDFRKSTSLPWMISLYYVTFYFMSLNIMRQMIAASIVFFATRYIQKKKYFTFFLAIIISFCFHKSSLVGLGFMGIEALQWKFLKKKQRMIIILLVLIGALGIPYVIIALSREYGALLQVSVDLGFLMPAKIFLVVLSLIALPRSINKEVDKDVLFEKYRVNFACISYIIGILTTSFGYFFDVVGRIGIVFYLYECIYLGYVVYKGKNAKIFRAITGTLVIYMFLTAIVGGGSGIVPYYFVWQNT